MHFSDRLSGYADGKGMTFTIGELIAIDSLLVRYAEVGSEALQGDIAVVRAMMRQPDTYRRFGVTVSLTAD